MANGVNLGDMSSLLLRKIEELTLYMIALKKENATFKVKTQHMKKEYNARIQKLEQQLASRRVSCIKIRL
jgi:hypothetical protein